MSTVFGSMRRHHKGIKHMNALSHLETKNMMTEDEARKRVTTINAGMNNIRALLLDFHEREGWKALKYDSWRECVVAEFGQSQAYLYRQLEAAQIEERINQASIEAGEKSFSPIGEKEIPESQLRPLAAVPPEDQPAVYALAKETAKGKLTAAHVERTVREVTGEKDDRCHACADHRRKGSPIPGVTVPGAFGKCIREGGPCEKPRQIHPVPKPEPEPRYLPSPDDDDPPDPLHVAEVIKDLIDESMRDDDPRTKDALKRIAVHVWNRQHNRGDV